MKNPGDFALRAAGLTRKLRAVCGVVLSYLVIFSLSARAWAQPAFLRKDIQVAGQYAGFQIQVRSGSVASGDYNGDSRPDLVLSSFWGIDVLLNTGGGNFGEPVHTECAGFCGPLVAADFNGDGKLDLVIPNPSSLIGHILFGRGDGSFSPPREIPGAGLATTGDINNNNDGKADLVVNDGVSLLVRLGNGDGTFQSGVMLSRGPALSETNNLAIADFDGDGHADLVVSSGNARAASPHYAVSVFLGQGDGTFQPPISTPVGAATLLVADLNSDGLPDLITGFDILFGKGDGSFQLPRPYFSPESVVDLPAPFAAVDFDGDGLLDLAVGSCYLYAARNQVSIFRGKGDGTMLPPVEYTVGWDPCVGVSADFDGDGRPDLATANLVSNSVSLLLSAGAGDSRLTRAVSAASGTTVVAPVSLATLYLSTGVSGAAQAGAPPWPTRLGGISLEIRDSSGTTRLAPLLYVSASQTNFLVPEGTAFGEATLSIVNDSGSTQAGIIQVGVVAPGLFVVTSYSLTPAAFLVRVEPDGSPSTQALFECSGPDSCAPVRVGAPAAGSKSYLVFYGTGFRNATPVNVKCMISFSEFPVEYAGPGGDAGLDLIRIPLHEANGDDFWSSVYVNPVAEVVLSIDGVLANRVLLAFSAPEPPCWLCK